MKRSQINSVNYSAEQELAQSQLVEQFINQHSEEPMLHQQIEHSEIILALQVRLPDFLLTKEEYDRIEEPPIKNYKYQQISSIERTQVMDMLKSNKQLVRKGANKK